MEAASFRDVTFNWIEFVHTGGRAVVEHQYPDQIDDQGRTVASRDPWVQDTSALVTGFVARVVFFGPNEISQAADFIALLRIPGPGRLVHPHYGEFQAVATTWDEKHDLSKGIAEISITWRVTGPAELVAVIEDIEDIEETRLSDLQVLVIAIQNAFRDALDTKGRIESVITGVISETAAAIDTISQTIQAVTSPAAVSRIRGKLGGLSAATAHLGTVADPRTIAAQWADLFAGTDARAVYLTAARMAATAPREQLPGESVNDYQDYLDGSAIAAVTQASLCLSAAIQSGITDPLPTRPQQLALAGAIGRVLHRLASATPPYRAATPELSAAVWQLAANGPDLLRSVATTLPVPESIPIQAVNYTPWLLPDLALATDPEVAIAAIEAQNPDTDGLAIPPGALEVLR